MWRTVSHRRDPTLEQKSVRSPPPEEEGGAETILVELISAHIPLCHLRAEEVEETRKSEVKLQEEWRGGGQVF